MTSSERLVLRLHEAEHLGTLDIEASRAGEMDLHALESAHTTPTSLHVASREISRAA